MKSETGHSPGDADGVLRPYQLVCSCCGKRQFDDGLILECPEDHEPALLRTDYANQEFSPNVARTGLARYAQWLPVTRLPQDVGRTVVYQSKGLAQALGLPDLWIAFNGYWPERGAGLDTATFKEFEAHTVLGRLAEHKVILTVSSSGNTGAAFAQACSRLEAPCLLIVPGKGLQRLNLRAPLHPCVNLISIDDGDYTDATQLASAMSRIDPFYLEGGIKNVGRRDGLGTVLLAAFDEMGFMPSYYFQAVGSGTGAVAVLEAAERLRGNRGVTHLPRLMMCQNLPFTPIYDRWRQAAPPSNGAASSSRSAAARIHADELANRTPPYEVRGSVYDSLMKSRGDVLVADNAAVRKAADMFAELEGIDIEPAASVAVACLVASAVEDQLTDGPVLLNITGGGRRKLAVDHPLYPAVPRMRLNRDALASERTRQEITEACVLSLEERGW